MLLNRGRKSLGRKQSGKGKGSNTMSKYYTWKKGGNKININTGFKSFDNYIVCISSGNCIGKGQISFYIRPYNETFCNGKENKLGCLRDYDLSMFGNLLDTTIKNKVKSITESVGCTLYAFSTKRGVFGYIIEQNNKYDLYIPPYQICKDKKYNCLKYIEMILKEEK